MIRTEILSMPDGNCSIKEHDLTRKFGISRTLVRESLKQLEAEKLIDRRRNRGTTVRKFTIKEIADTYDLRAVLEGFAGHQAANKITTGQLAELEKLAGEYKEVENDNADPKMRTELDDRFHQKIVEIADNSQLHDIMRHFSILKQAFAVYWKKDTGRRKLQKTPFSHEKIVKAIADGNGVEAEQLLRKHVQWAEQHLLESFIGDLPEVK